MYIMRRRDCLRYLLIFPGMLFVGAKRLWACSNPYPIYISSKDIYGKTQTTQSQYLSNIYKRYIDNDKNNIGKVKVGNAEYEREIPVAVSLPGLNNNQFCKGMDLYVEVRHATNKNKPIFSYYKLGAYRFNNNATPYISSRYRAIGGGETINVIAIAMVEEGLKERLIKFESGEINLNQCNPLVAVDSDETTIRNNECIDARSWVGYRWEELQNTDYCRNLYKSIGWPVFK